MYQETLLTWLSKWMREKINKLWFGKSKLMNESMPSTSTVKNFQQMIFLGRFYWNLNIKWAIYFEVYWEKLFTWLKNEEGKKYKNVIWEFKNGWIHVNPGRCYSGLLHLMQLKPMSLAYRKLVSTQKIDELVESLYLGRI